MLKIVFVSGRVYEYKAVPKRVFELMKKARSKGIFFNRNVKNSYEFEMIS